MEIDSYKKIKELDREKGHMPIGDFRQKNTKNWKRIIKKCPRQIKVKVVRRTGNLIVTKSIDGEKEKER